MTIQYLDLLADILDNGVAKGDRTGTGTTSVFGRSMRFDLAEGFPLLTTKKLPLRWIAEELLWMLSGSTNEHDLSAKGVDIWSEWSTAEQCAKFGREPGDLGPTYGFLWRRFGEIDDHDGRLVVEGVDQIAEIIRTLNENPNSRRIILTGWDPRVANDVALPPCHTLTQFYVADGKLSSQMYMRSADVFLGVPFNLASYALLTHMLAHVCNLDVGEFVMCFGDVHIYNNHREQVREQIERDPRPLPELLLDPAVKSIDDFEWRHIEMRGYDAYPTIKAPVSV